MPLARGPADDSALRLSHDVGVTDKGARRYSDDERRQQLSQLARLCSTISEALRSHGEAWPASLFAERAERANRLLAEGWDRTSLTDVSAQFPAGPDWLNPKAVDFGAPRKSWQDDVAAL